MLNVERPVGVGCNPGETVLEDDLHDLAIMTTVTDPLVVQIFYDFHGLFSFLFIFGTTKMIQDMVGYIQILQFHSKYEFLCAKGKYIWQNCLSLCSDGISVVS